MVKIKKNDEVIVISGKNKGSSGRVLSVDRKNNTLKIDKVNIVKKHVKPTQTNPDGGIHEFEAPIHISNVAFAVTKGKLKIASKISFKTNEKGHKKRIAMKTGKDV